MSLFSVLVLRGLRAQIVTKKVLGECWLNVSIVISVARYTHSVASHVSVPCATVVSDTSSQY